MRNNERHERNDRHERVASKQEGRRSAEKRTKRNRIDKRCGARPFSCLPTAGGPRPRTCLRPQKWSGRARLSAPHRGIRGFGLGSAQAALPGTTGCKREDPLRHQCSEHLAVRHAPDGTMPKPPASAVYRYAHENRSRSALRSTLAKGVPLRAGFWGDYPGLDIDSQSWQYAPTVEVEG